MIKPIAASFAAALLLAACAAPDTVNLTQGTWGPQTIVPPSGLIHSRYDGMVGASISTWTRPNSLTVEAVLIDPRDNIVDYVVARPTIGSGDLVTIPISQIQNNSQGLYVEATDYTISTLPHMSVAQLEATYAAQPIAAAPAYAPPGAYYPPGVSPQPTVGESLRLHRRGNLVGYQVVDGYGTPIGMVDSVAMLPQTGEVRFLIVAGPSFGSGNYIAVPYASSTTTGGRIVVNGTAAGWMQVPRYRNDQVVQVFGALGTE